MVLLTMTRRTRFLTPLPSHSFLFSTPFLILVLSTLLAACAPVQEPCVRLSYDGPRAMNVLLVRDGFDEAEFDGLARSVRETLLAKEPFASNPRINFYAVDNDDDAVCVAGDPLPVLGEAASDPLAPLECDVEAMRRLAASCNVERAKLIILTNDTVAAQTSITYAESGVMFLDMKNQPPEIIQHEFAHFFGLVDERPKLYSHALGAGREPAPNCVPTPERAEAAWRRFYPENHSFPQGCAGNPDWFAPEYPTLLSKFPDPSWGYGAFTTWYLNETLTCCYSGDGRMPAAEGRCAAFFERYPAWNACREGSAS